METFEHLGNNQVIDRVHGQIGETYKLFKSLKSPYKERAANDLRRIKYNIGVETFNCHLNEITKELNFTLESLYR